LRAQDSTRLTGSLQRLRKNSVTTASLGPLPTPGLTLRTCRPRARRPTSQSKADRGC